MIRQGSLVKAFGWQILGPAAQSVSRIDESTARAIHLAVHGAEYPHCPPSPSRDLSLPQLKALLAVSDVPAVISVLRDLPGGDRALPHVLFAASRHPHLRPAFPGYLAQAGLGATLEFAHVALSRAPMPSWLKRAFREYAASPEGAGEMAEWPEPRSRRKDPPAASLLDVATLSHFWVDASSGAISSRTALASLDGGPSGSPSRWDDLAGALSPRDLFSTLPARAKSGKPLPKEVTRLLTKAAYRVYPSQITSALSRLRSSESPDVGIERALCDALHTCVKAWSARVAGRRRVVSVLRPGSVRREESFAAACVGRALVGDSGGRLLFIDDAVYDASSRNSLPGQFYWEAGPRGGCLSVPKVVHLARGWRGVNPDSVIVLAPRGNPKHWAKDVPKGCDVLATGGEFRSDVVTVLPTPDHVLRWCAVTEPLRRVLESPVSAT